METVVINGQSIDGDNIVINGNNVTIDGKEAQGFESTKQVIIERIEGNFEQFSCSESLIVKNGDIKGSVSVGGSLNCNGIEGDVEVGWSINCDDISGDVHAGGSVNCDMVGGGILGDKKV